jgi:4-carboxymuconolactone decarboxylase
VTGRVQPLTRDEITPAARADLRVSFPRATRFLADGPHTPPMPPILGLLARHTAISGPWLAFSGALLDHGMLDGRTRELLVLATAHRTGTDYLWQEHVPLAAAAGLRADEVRAVRGESPHAWANGDAALLAMVDELVSDQQVDDGTWYTLAQRLDEQQLIEALFVVGTYCCLAMVLKNADLTVTEAP